MRKLYYSFFVYVMLAFCSLISCVGKTLEKSNHPLYQHVPVHFGMSLSECKNVIPSLVSVKQDTLEFPHYMVNIDSTNSVHQDNLFIIGTFYLGFDENRLRRIFFRCIDMTNIKSRSSNWLLKSSEQHFSQVIDLCCEKFINCQEFKIYKTLDERSWETLSSEDYSINFKWQGRDEFLYIVELKE